MMDYRNTAGWLSNRLPQKPESAIILGTGLSDMAEAFPLIMTIPYTDIPGFVNSTAPSHKGNLILAEMAGKAVLFLQGRFHFYEGHSMEQVVFPTRVLAAMGVKNLIVTNAAGSLRKELPPGSIVQLIDHINFMGRNPLVGHNDEDLGERFPSLNQLYDPQHRELCDQIALRHGINTFKGVYLAVSGPSLETKAECAAFAMWGADLVGMSTVPEVIAARHAGLRVLAYSIVTNYSNLFHEEAHSQDEIRHHAAIAGKQLQTILSDFIALQD
ncbi:MAG: purine-nucleoside phosphorylase [Candidatus Cloacimonetes bacterium]|jgi:purine-nucleoside phosphorylase|nr:purine-nucleoside phosphorylase [Candidatus Cloacimonadota bacterium]MDY0337088.1 purine-nucleoside phosphorylase [Candidatus Cloacimonadaceae bacterium]MCB5269033.1 purine-nucleoside phosphorylase [Candidatus Cloacimonadota bacterium]MCK9334413.1 purine-nucleoside phosphorylase [Candidatus Cloacimonadota bacterium]MDD2543916.1 purine-nucleoside phosphorylase [Candidatus Cloacimonadota bacterium]